MADVGHLMASWPVHMKWVEGLTEEFFSQGDDEKRTDMPVSFLMDRDRPGVSSSQVGGGSLFSLSFSSLSIFSLFLPPSLSLSLVLALSRSLSHSPPRVVRTCVRTCLSFLTQPPTLLPLSLSLFLPLYLPHTHTHAHTWYTLRLDSLISSSCRFFARGLRCFRRASPCLTSLMFAARGGWRLRQRRRRRLHGESWRRTVMMTSPRLAGGSS